MNGSAFLLACWALVFLSVQTKSQHLTRSTYYDGPPKTIKTHYHVLDTNSNVAHGGYVSYFTNGNIQSKGTFSYDRPVGKWEFFYESGELKMVNTPLQKGGDRVSQVYYYRSGRKRMVGEVQANHRWGIWKGYAEDGRLQSETNYNGPVARRIEYYASGKVLGEGDYKDAKKTGLWKYFAENKALIGQGNYKAGKKEGIWKHYDSLGVLVASGNYQNGEKTKKWEYFFDNGAIKSQGHYQGDKKTGIWHTFFMDGALEIKSTFTATGVERVVMYYATGETKAMGDLENGQKHGKWLYFYQNGRKKGEADFTQGSGLYFGYDLNGRLNMKGHIENDRQIGLWEMYGTEDTLNEEDSSANQLDSARLDQRIVDETNTPKKTPDQPAKKNTAHKKHRYFSPRFPEYKGIILQTNPFITFFGWLPISFEFYNQDRLGHEFVFGLIRNPFFKPDSDVQQGEVYRRGYEVAIRQKLYHPVKIGLWYFGHELVFTSLVHVSKMIVAPSSIVYAPEFKVEYGVLVGGRLMGNTKRNGPTLDAHIGFTIGYRNFTTKLAYEELFTRVEKDPFAYTFRFGINFGYVISVNR